MRDRKILYILLLTAAVGSAVTLCTGFLTGGMDWAGQVTVTLEDKAEPAGNAERIAASDAEGGVNGNIAQPLGEPRAYEGNTTITGTGQEGLPAVDVQPQADAEAAAAAADVALAGDIQPEPDVALAGDIQPQPDMAPAGDIQVQADMAPAGNIQLQADMAPAGDIQVQADMALAGDIQPQADAAPSGDTGQAGEKLPAGAEAARDTAEPAKTGQQDGGTGGSALQAPQDNGTSAYVKEEVRQVALSPLETAAVYDSGSETMTASAVAADGGASSETENAYLKRLKELDAQIRKSREAQSAANTAGAGGNSQARNAADNELKLWDSELSTIYNEILKSLDEKEVQDLVTAERQWMKNRDAAAVEAAKNSAGGSLESVEYTASLAETTRARAYELVGLYASVLTERE